AEAPGGAGEPRFAVGDLKAFVARNADDGSGNLLDDETDGLDPEALLRALDGRSEDMARRAYDIFSLAFPEASGWALQEQARFIEQARKRFEAILAVVGAGDLVDEALVGDLEDVGANAAWSGSPLPQLLVILRISRDLVVQTAVEVAEERGRHWGLALSLLLTRVLPAMDRLTDAVAQGYWAAAVHREEESRARYESVVEQSSDGIFEVDLDGLVEYANPSLALILGHRLEELRGSPLGEILVPTEPSPVLEGFLTEPAEGSEGAEGADSDQDTRVRITRPDGVCRVLDITRRARREGQLVVGYQGVVRDVTAAREMEAAKNKFLALITHDLRQPLTTVLGLAATLETYAGELPRERMQRIGVSIRHQAERVCRLADDLHDVSLLESRQLVLGIRPVDLTTVVEVALAAACRRGGLPEVEFDVPTRLRVLGDARRLEQVIANLIENAVAHGAAPVSVRATTLADGNVEVSVRDHGPGVPVEIEPTLFSQLQTFSRSDRDRGRGTGLGLALVRGLVEAMGGRISHERPPDGGACFRLVLPAAPSVRT
ncbi:MAG: sensor histidine kinase, partial [Acidimicrobiales bacterium]